MVVTAGGATLSRVKYEFRIKMFLYRSFSLHMGLIIIRLLSEGFK